MQNALLWNLLLTAGLATVLGALCRLPSMRRRPALRHWLWLLLLVKLVTPPLIGVPLLPAVVGGDDTAATATPPGRPTGGGESAWYGPSRAGPAVEDRTSAFVDQGGGRDVSAVTSQQLRGAARTAYLGGLFAVSLVGTCVLLAVYGARAAKVSRWLKRAGRESSWLSQCCTDVASSLGVRGVVRSCVVDTRTTPLLWGWRRPLVVVPRQLIDDLNPQQLRSIVAHELAHLSRHDHWANAFVFLVKLLLWWNPVVWWADRELRAAQELCCDAMAIDRCKANRRSYATTLLKALDFIQAEPWAPRELAPGMGSRGSILRRFEMIGETKLSYQLSAWTLLILLGLGAPLVCFPVRGQGEGPAVPATPAPSDPGVVSTATDTGGTKAETAKLDGAESAGSADAEPIDPKIKELGEAVRKRLTTYSDEETLLLKHGQTGRMKVKKNITPVAEILITARRVKDGTKFDLEGLDAQGKAIEGTSISSRTIHDAQSMRMGLGKNFSADGENILCKIQLTPTRQGDDSVSVEVKVLFTRLPTPEELEAMLLTRGKDGKLHSDFGQLSLWIMQHRQIMGHYPEDLEELDKPLPKDVYSPTGEDYRYEAQRRRFILSSCGKDGIYGNDDDEIYIAYRGGATSGQRHELYPLEEEDEAEAQTETVYGERPQGSCSISGKVVSAATGRPVDHATMYLHYSLTHGSIFIEVASDGSFRFEDIPRGPFSLRTSHTAGYQDAVYDPEGESGSFPQFSLEEGEHRSGIVLEVEQACRISGKVLDENREIPKDTDTLRVLAWIEKDDGEGYKSEQGLVNRTDGSYVIDGLGSKPAYVMAINWRAAREGNACPPIYYPGTFFRGDAKPITFDEGRYVENIDITLQKEGGLILEGTVIDKTGKPVPEAFVVAHRRDMLFDFVTSYTDEQGRYQIQGLGVGEFLVHVDAVHRGLVRMRTPIDLDRARKRTQRDFTLAQGVTISGKFVDQEGNDWQIGQSYGHASVITDQERESSSFSLTSFWNKHRPKNVRRGSGGSFSPGEGGYESGQMLFPTKSTFVIQGMMPGQTLIGFSPQKEGQQVVKILYDGRDIKESGIKTEPGQEIKDVTVVIGKG